MLESCFSFERIVGFFYRCAPLCTPPFSTEFFPSSQRCFDISADGACVDMRGYPLRPEVALTIGPSMPTDDMRMTCIPKPGVVSRVFFEVGPANCFLSVTQPIGFTVSPRFGHMQSDIVGWCNSAFGVYFRNLSAVKPQNCPHSEILVHSEPMNVQVP